MPLDHYVSQVHLRNFYSPALGGMMFAIRKADLKAFKCRSQDVCRTADGSTNKYLEEPRAVERFLQDVEPKYNASLQKFRDRKPDPEAIFALAGFVAYVTSCSPAAMRLSTSPLESILKGAAKVLDAQGMLGKAPSSLGGKSLTELLNDGAVEFEVDPKYPQAISTASIIERTSLFGNGRWEVILNKTASPFVTSDFPVAIKMVGPSSINRVVPLAPDLAVRITPSAGMRGKTDLAFPGFNAVGMGADHREVALLNRLIVQCAEETVFYRDDLPWVQSLVTKNRAYRIETVVYEIPHGSGTMTLASQRVARREEI